MELLGNFFDKYRHLELHGQAAKQVVAKTVGEITGFPVDVEAVTIRGYEVYLTLPAKHKVLVIMHRDKIMGTLKDRLRDKPYRVG
jgi:hypothetical protein